MWFLSALLFGISASLDALILGISYGLRGIHIKFKNNFIISLITLLGTCLSVGFGERLVLLIPKSINIWIGSITLIGYGLFYIIKFTINLTKKYTSKTEKEKNDTTDSIIITGILLSLNNIGIGLGASIAGLRLLPAAVSTFSFSLLFLLVGNNLGRSRLSSLLGSAADPVSGLLLIGLGVWELFF